MHSRILLGATVLALTAGAALADSLQFEVNAQYRGAFKKAFTDIGAGELTDTGSGGNFRLVGRADVEHPKQKDKVYHLQIDMSFRQTGGTIQEVANASRCNPGAEDALSTTLKLMPFVHLTKWLPNDSGEVAVTTPRGQFTVHLARTDKNLEATVDEGGRMVGKFFLAGESLPRRMDKFRITTKSGTVLSFVTTPKVASSR